VPSGCGLQRHASHFHEPGLALVAILKVQRGLAGGELLDLAQRRRAVVGMHEIEERSRQQLRFAPAERRGEGGVDALEITVRPGNAEQVQREREEAVALGLRLPPLFKVAPHHDAGEADQTEGQQTAKGHHRHRRAGQRLRPGRALPQELGFFGLRFAYQPADFVHRLLALSRGDELRCPGGVAAAAQPDTLVHEADFLFNQRLDHGQPALLVGIVLRQAFRRRERLLSRRDPGLIRLQERFVAGGGKPATPRFDVEQLHQRRLERIHDFAGVIHRAKGFRVPLRAPPRGHAGEEQTGQGHGEPRLNLLLNRHFHNGSAGLNTRRASLGTIHISGSRVKGAIFLRELAGVFSRLTGLKNSLCEPERFLPKLILFSKQRVNFSADFFAHFD
jgi:hypothetical protein